eukprot:m.1196427 g.1196427  ORF g.1196427 m.1196427 type:complete len:345 (+) comp24563_c0_seq70:827-1861(+)
MWGLESSTSIHLTQLTLEHGGWFTMLATNCSDLVITDVTVKADRDGLDIVGCRDVVVDRVSVTGGGDDAIVLKSDFSLGAVLHTNNVTVTNAVVSCGCNGLNFGSETVGDFSDVYWANITVLSAGKAGIGVVSMDGANIFNVIYRNISIRECYTPLFFFIGARLRRPDTAHPGSISGVYLDTISVDHSTYKGKGNVTATIDGEPAVTNIEEGVHQPTPEIYNIGPNITVRNLSVVTTGGGAAEDVHTDPPHNSSYYQPRMLGVRPAYAMFLRRVIGLTIANTSLTYSTTDYRPAFVLDNVHNVTLDGVCATAGRNTRYDIITTDSTAVRIMNPPPYCPQLRMQP